MISVLICSTNPVLLDQVTKNISTTIGTEFEILHFDNRKANKALCEVYNELGLRANFPYICFLHEDVLFKTPEWGKKLNEIFLQNKDIGLIGIAGCKYKSQFFSGWFSNVKELDCANYIHQYKDGIEHVNLSPDNNNTTLQEVVCIDGVFMCCRKEVCENNRFNYDLLKGFHFYDIDFSLRIARNYIVVVTYEIELIHITTGGDYGNNWIIESIKYHEQMKSELPFSKIHVELKSADRKVIKATLDFLRNYNITLSNKIKWVTRQKLYLKPIFYYSIFKFFLYKPLRLKYIHNLFRSK
jgi:hypothetical protein